MKSIFKILALVGVVVLIAPTAQAADKGSQLLFITDTGMDMSEMGMMGDPLVNFISITNTSVNVPDLDGVEGEVLGTPAGNVTIAESAKAVTVLVQYYNDEVTPVLEFLRVLRGGETVLVNPFNHMVPGEDPPVNVLAILNEIPMMTDPDMGAGFNSGRFVIAVTAVGANTVEDADTAAIEGNAAPTVNILFPTYLAADLHGTNNIDNCGDIKIAVGTTPEDNNLMLTKSTEEDNECKKEDDSSKNVGPLSVGNAQPIAFNYLTGHHTTGQASSSGDGSDQTASWGVNALTRPALMSEDDGGMMLGTAYTTLDGDADETRLAEKVHGGVAANNTRGAIATDDDEADRNNRYAGDKILENEPQIVRGINHGALVWSSLYGADGTDQEVQFLSVADAFDGAGKYKLMPAMTKYKVVLHDNAGGVFIVPGAEAGPNYRGGAGNGDPVASTDIVVAGIRVLTNALEGKCGGTMVAGGWNVTDLTDLSMAASEGTEDFMGLDDPDHDDPAMGRMNASRGWVKFLRGGPVKATQKCVLPSGDGDSSMGATDESPDNIPVKDDREFTTGTFIVEDAENDDDGTERVYVTMGQIVLKYETPTATFGASWWLTEK